jgi:peptide/nickel transport system permease protein
MVRYLIRRLFWAAVLFIVITLVTYVIFFLIPADPARLAAGKAATPEQIARVRHFLGLDKPVWYQYYVFLKRLVWEHSLGRSFANRESINEVIRRAAPVTASLVFGGAILWMLIALPVGILSALRPRSIGDRVSMGFVLVGISAHPVWIGLIFSYFFGYKWGLTPITGYCNLFRGPNDLCGGFHDWFVHMILPWCTFAILFAGLYVRMIRANVMDTMGEDYVRTARAKGAPERTVMRSHILRNAMLPVVTMLGMDIGIALGGAIFTESVYSLPGLGQVAVNGLTNSDLPQTQGVVVFAAIAVISFNIIVDVLYAFIDPRIRLS